MILWVDGNTAIQSMIAQSYQVKRLSLELIKTRNTEDLKSKQLEVFSVNSGNWMHHISINSIQMTIPKMIWEKTSAETLDRARRVLGATPLTHLKSGITVLKLSQKLQKDYGVHKLLITEDNRIQPDTIRHAKLGHLKSHMHTTTLLNFNQMPVWLPTFAEIQMENTKQFGAIQMNQSKNGSIVIQSLINLQFQKQEWS